LAEAAARAHADRLHVGFAHALVCRGDGGFHRRWAAAEPTVSPRARAGSGRPGAAPECSASIFGPRTLRRSRGRDASGRRAGSTDPPFSYQLGRVLACAGRPADAAMQFAKRWRSTRFIRRPTMSSRRPSPARETMTRPSTSSRRAPASGGIRLRAPHPWEPRQRRLQAARLSGHRSRAAADACEARIRSTGRLRSRAIVLGQREDPWPGYGGRSRRAMSIWRRRLVANPIRPAPG